jgi:hypothetical protein
VLLLLLDDDEVRLDLEEQELLELLLDDLEHELLELLLPDDAEKLHELDEDDDDWDDAENEQELDEDFDELVLLRELLLDIEQDEELLDSESAMD